MVEQNIIAIIAKYGREVLTHPLFLQSFSQTHHHVSNVGDHTLGVTVIALRYCMRHHLTAEGMLSEVVQACLCHDLGILGRKNKFANDWECLHGHPRDSLSIYQEIYPDTDATVENAISHHMFPLFSSPPSQRVGWILVMADKVSSARERLGRPAVTPKEREEILAAVGAFARED